MLYQNQEVIQPGIPNSHYQLPLTSHQQTFAINYEIIQGKSTITSRYNIQAFISSENFLCQASVLPIAIYYKTNLNKRVRELACNRILVHVLGNLKLIYVLVKFLNQNLKPFNYSQSQVISEKTKIDWLEN